MLSLPNIVRLGLPEGGSFKIRFKTLTQEKDKFVLTSSKFDVSYVMGRPDEVAGPAWACRRSAALARSSATDLVWAVDADADADDDVDGDVK